MVFVGQCNIRSLNTSASFVENLCIKRNIGIPCLSEIWHPDVSKINVLNNWSWYTSIRESQEGGGAAIIVRPDIKSFKRPDLTVAGLEAIWCEVTIGFINILICSVYIPPDNQADMHLLISQLRKMELEQNVLIVGDFNAKHPQWYNDKTNNLGNIFNKYLLTSPYIIVNDESKTYKQSIIDLTIVKGCKDIIKEWSAYPDLFINSDHNMILFEPGRITSTQRPRWKLKGANWDEWKMEIDDIFRDLNSSREQIFDVNELYNILKSKLIEHGMLKLGKYSTFKNYKSWWDKELSTSYKLVQKSFRAFQRRSDSNKRDAYYKLKQEFYSLYCKKEETYWNSVISNIDAFPEKTWKIIEKHTSMPVKPTVQPIKSADGKVAFQDEEIAKEFCITYGKDSSIIDETCKKEEAEKMKISLNTDSNHPFANVYLNKVITVHEVTDSIKHVKNDTSTSPEEDIPALFLKNSGAEFVTYLVKLFNLCLNEGKLPDAFLLDHKIVIPKPFKENYNTCKSYRPITLESLVGKCFIRIIYNRLHWFFETNNLFSATQDAYRHNHSCNDLVLRLTQSIQEAWNRKETVVLACIDFESYFETIWRERLINKLSSSGVNGNILKVLHTYLCSRFYRFAINDHQTEWSHSSVGLSQGGILSTILTNFYSAKSDNSIDSSHGEFADDNYKWETHQNEHVAATRLQIRLDCFSRWCLLNNIGISSSKIKIMFFRPPASPRPFNKIEISLNGNVIEEVEEERILGTILDNKLSFIPHFDLTIRKAYGKLNSIKSFLATNHAPRINSVLRIYKCLLRSRINFSTAACVNITDISLAKLVTFQRNCLLLATGCISSTNIEALNLICNVLPIDLYLKVKTSEAMIKILSHDSPLSRLYYNWNATKASEKHLSSFAKICSSIRQILRTRSVPEIHPESIWDKQEPPFVEPGLVIQPRRDKEQQIQLVNETIHENDFDIIICTDGSTIKKNSKYLGQTGSAAVIYEKSLQSTENVLSCEVGSMSHNYIGELVAIKLALSYLIDRQLKNKSIFLLTDCTAAMEMSFTNALPKAYAKQIRANRKLILTLRKSGNRINSTWIPAHMNFIGNEVADSEAKKAAARAIYGSKENDFNIILLQLREQVMQNWQFRIDIDLATNRAYSIKNKVGIWNIPCNSDEYTKYLMQFATGHHNLRSSEILWNPDCVSSLCECGIQESFEHFTFQCERYIAQRFILLNLVNSIDDQRYSRLSQVPLMRLFGQDPGLSQKDNQSLISAFISYIKQTRRFK